jgi:hypothetical protein
VVDPHWKGEKPAGITAAVRSSTELGFAIPRMFNGDTAEDTDAIQPLVNRLIFYPLSQFSGEMKTTNWRQLSSFPV